MPGGKGVDLVLDTLYNELNQTGFFYSPHMRGSQFVTNVMFCNKTDVYCYYLAFIHYFSV